mmetsp:Transcript_36367/g.61987  ORF Transcript_36367/g.61987 Transcript_36367/m.61987 type:complete len:174 (-) Transcript_36367:415-936(-)|eukprot:CAMPEP_0183731326 /NCGR_PEP_ID=MMETSP0737-20130205/35041_1 /TAXON_ID=385413 /ORGANISM="Thalassiosira miniscula, Strain CCMP1093" /LENGTH=173 /DNA_ID=CAMNT_0025964027 /DNA_START=83 /DNA_END=604 /DNA_ORIENTATION=+
MNPSMRCNSLIAAVALLLAASMPIGVASFQLHRSAPLTARATAARPITSLYNDNQNKESDIPRDEEIVGEQYEGSVDWDAEWKKVVQDRDQPAQRPGNYKSQAEIAAIKATNKVAKNVYDASREAKNSLPSAPSIRSLQGDWRFWIGMLLIVSFGLSILSATSSAPVNDSFYI